MYLISFLSIIAGVSLQASQFLMNSYTSVTIFCIYSCQSCRFRVEIAFIVAFNLHDIVDIGCSVLISDAHSCVKIIMRLCGDYSMSKSVGMMTSLPKIEFLQEKPIFPRKCCKSVCQLVYDVIFIEAVYSGFQNSRVVVPLY